MTHRIRPIDPHEQAAHPHARYVVTDAQGRIVGYHATPTGAAEAAECMDQLLDDLADHGETPERWMRGV